MFIQICAQAKGHWLENSARFKPAEMVAAIEGIRIQMLQAYTMAFIFTTNELASRMCNNGGIAASKTKKGDTLALTMCLWSPAELCWQQNAGGRFKQNVATLMSMDESDVQAMVIVGIPAQAIDEAGCKDSATFTIEERAEKLKLLVPLSGSDTMYSAAHIAKMYELEPSTLVEKRKELVQVRKKLAGLQESGEELNSGHDSVFLRNTLECERLEREIDTLRRFADVRAVPENEEDDLAELERIFQQVEKDAQTVANVHAVQHSNLSPTKEELAWLRNLQRQGKMQFRVKHGPLLLGPGRSMTIQKDVEGKCIGQNMEDKMVPLSDGGWSEFVPAVEVEPEKRCNVPVHDRLCVVIASKWVGHGNRSYLLVHKGREGPAFKEATQALCLEGCALMWASETMSDHPGCASLTVAPAHARMKTTLHFSSLHHDTKQALKETRQLCNELKDARERNQTLDCCTMGDVVFGAKYAIVSLPGEEMDLRAQLWNASEDAIRRTFSGETSISLCSVWTGQQDDVWWHEWKQNTVQAYDDGQILLVFSRRGWKTRTEEEDMIIEEGENKYTYLPKPYAPVELKKGDPISPYGVTQKREIAWLH